MVNLFPGVPAECLCDKHLNSVLAEYNNLLMPSMRKGYSIRKYLDHGCIDLLFIGVKILDCMKEANKRGKKWKYPYLNEKDCELHGMYLDRYTKELLGSHSENFDFTLYYFGNARRKEMAEMNMRILSFRCPECRKRIKDYQDAKV